MRTIHFIINPISGSGTNTILETKIYNYFPKSEFTIQVFFSQYKNHATELANASVLKGVSTIVAIGGDGTINEIASCIVGKKTFLGIIPTGSGNGLASNLNIPVDVDNALKLIKDGKFITIDVGQVNGNYFFSNSGVGFDAQVIKNYENSKEHTIVSYAKSCLKTLKEFKTNRAYNISINGEKIRCTPFMIFVSNSNELGYNLSLTPKASLKDGLFDVLIVSKISKLKILLFAFLILFKKHLNLKEVDYYVAKTISICNDEHLGIEYQLDGEMKFEKSNQVTYKICSSALDVIC